MASEPTIGRRRRAPFRLLALLLGLAPFLLAELFLRAMGWGRPEAEADPFVGFDSTQPLFTLDKTGDRYEISQSRRDFFQPDSFAAEKADNECRVFCLGGSTVQGRPYSIETSFTTWLELSLRAADPGRRWRVVNCGGVSYASYRLIPILEEVLGYEPDLIVVYSGHNEFLEDRSYGHIKRLPVILAWPYKRLARLRLYVLLRKGFGGARSTPGASPEAARPILPTEAEALLDYRGGLEKYERNDEWRRGVIDHFGYNLHRMVDMARDANVPILLVNPGSNLRHCPPFKSQNKDGLSEEELDRWWWSLEDFKDALTSDVARATALLEQAVEIDDRHATTRYLLGKCYEMQGEMAKALEEYKAAKEQDVCPLRIVEPMNRLVLEVGRDTKTPVYDAREALRRLSKDGIPGSDYYIDHVHPTILGHQLIARGLFGEIARLGMVAETPGWEERRDRIYEDHLSSLDGYYYAAGRIRLRNLRLWAAGRGEIEPPPGHDGRRRPGQRR